MVDICHNVRLALGSVVQFMILLIELQKVLSQEL